MNGVQRLAKVFMLDNERDIRLGSALGASDHADARTSQRTEQLPGDTRGTFHVLAYNSDGSQILLRYGIVHITLRTFQGELVVQYLYGQISVGVTYGESRIILGAGLRYHKYADAILGERLKDPVVHADHAHHT